MRGGQFGLILANLAAAGASQTDAALIVAATTYATGATGANGVKLPAIETGKILTVYNSDGTNALLVYPTAGASHTINGGTANTAISVPAKTMVLCVCNSTTNWAAMIVNTVAAADTIAEVTPGAGVTVDGVLCKDGGVTATGSIQAHANVTVTAITGGATTGLIPAGTSFVTVTSDNANKQITLPAGTVGDVIRIYVGTNGCELIAATAGDKVNNVIVGATNEAALVATTTYTCQYVGTNTWLMSGQTYLGAVEAAVVPDSAA